MIKQEEIKKKSRCFGRDIGKMLCIGAGTGVVTFILLFLCGTLFGGGFSNGLEMAKNGLFLTAALLLFVVAGMVMGKGKKKEPEFKDAGWRKYFSVIGLKTAVMILGLAFLLLGTVLDYILIND